MWLIVGIWVVELSFWSIAGAVPLLLLALMFSDAVIENWKMLRSGTRSVDGEVKQLLHYSDEGVSKDYMEVAGQKFSIPWGLSNKLQDGDRITVYFFGEVHRYPLTLEVANHPTTDYCSAEEHQCQ